SNDGLRRDRRFKYLHAKYMVIDEETILVSSENFGTHGFSPSATLGSRGWVVTIKNPTLASEYVKIFEDDITPKKGYSDLVRYGKSPEYTLSNPEDVKQDREVRSGKYVPVPARVVR